MRTCLIPALALALTSAAGPARAATIDVGYHSVRPEPHQAIPIYVHGEDQVLGMSLYAQIPGTGSRPVFDGEPAEILDRSIWADGDVWTGYIDPYRLYLGITTPIGAEAIRADGLLATLYVDAAGLPRGLHRLQLRNDAEEDATNFGRIQPEITHGWIAVAPEPTSLCILVLCASTVLRSSTRARP
jgi:hypothetical protein